MANRWSANASYAYNNAVEHFGTAALEDPTCVADVCPGDFQYAPESAGSGIGNVFQNSKWLAKVSGRVHAAVGRSTSPETLAAGRASRSRSRS